MSAFCLLTPNYGATEGTSPGSDRGGDGVGGVPDRYAYTSRAFGMFQTWTATGSEYTLLQLYSE